MRVELHLVVVRLLLALELLLVGLGHKDRRRFHARLFLAGLAGLLVVAVLALFGLGGLFGGDFDRV